MLKYRLLLVFVITILIGGYFYFKPSLFQNTQPQKYSGPIEKITIALPLAGTELNTLTFVAEDMGYFKDQGLEVLIKDVPSSVAGEKEVIEGGADIAGVGDYTFVINSFREKTLKIIAEVDKNDYIVVAARKDKGIINPSDVKGKKIVIIPKTISEIFLHRFLIENQISDKDIQIIPVNSGDELISAIVDNNADVFVSNLPQLYDVNKALKGGMTILYDNKNSPFFWLLIATDETLIKRPLVVQRFLRALVSAESLVRENKQEAQTILKKRFPDKEQDYFDLVWPKHSFEVTLGQSLLITMEDEARFAIANKLTDKTVVPNYLNYIYFDALEKVKPEAITIVH